MQALIDEIRAIDSSRPRLRSFGLLLGLILLLIAGYRFWISGWLPSSSQFILLVAAATLSLAAVLTPRWFRPLFLVWMTFALVLGHVMTRVILILVFYLAVTPTALVLRVFRKDPMNRKLDQSLSTYWIEKDRKETMGERMKKYY